MNILNVIHKNRQTRKLRYINIKEKKTLKRRRPKPYTKPINYA